MVIKNELEALKRQRRLRQKEWYDHPVNIRKQLEMWDIPSEVIEKSDITSLLVDYEPGAENESAGAGTMLVERDYWSVSITLGSKTSICLATRWTGQEWEGDFHILEEDDRSWDTALSENNGKITKAIASMGLLAFYLDGEDSINTAL